MVSGVLYFLVDSLLGVLPDECELVSTRPAPLPSYAAQRPRHSFSAAARLFV